MNSNILNKDVQEFITNNLDTELSKLILKGTTFNAVSTKEIIEQIEAKKKSKTKLPTWFSCQNIYYPNKLNIEQTSSEISANYKSKLITGDSIIDITGGFGVDCFYFSKHFKSVTHCEVNKKLSQLVRHNYDQLECNHIKTITANGLEHIDSKKDYYDWIYIDPSRRHDSKGKVFFLKDCLPNIPLHLKNLFKYTKNIAIKTSPLLDFTIGIHELQCVKEIHVIAIKNEVKELIWILEADYKKGITVKTVNLNKHGENCFNFSLDEEAKSSSALSEPLDYLYEPNAAILKSGAFNTITTQFSIYKLHQHSHLYTSKKQIEFPGRSFVITHVIDYNKKAIKSLNLKQANITTRNFPETVKHIRKKFSIGDGGNTYLFFTTNHLNAKQVIICKKLE